MPDRGHLDAQLATCNETAPPDESIVIGSVEW